jgi:O-acetyl-ADP-ribose deacetylase (regulator of RNase III)/transcriptional regulator with XRE-family HTH domain
MPLTVISEDITKLKVDAIVNAANEQLQPGGGVCGAIFAGAGSLLKKDCQEVGHCPTGDAIITFGYKLKARYVVHAVGPVWEGGGRNEPALLSNCYFRSMELALTHDCKTVAFPLISAGIYGYPKDLAFHEAVSSIGSFLLKNPEMDVFLSIFPPMRIGLPPDLKEELSSWLPSGSDAAVFSEKAPPSGMDPLPGFIEALKTLMAAKGCSQEELAKRSNLKEAVVSKILAGEEEISAAPSKKTALSLALGLGLDGLETKNFLARTGQSLDPSSKTDLILAFFLERGITDIFLISEALYAFGEPFLNE